MILLNKYKIKTVGAFNDWDKNLKKVFLIKLNLIITTFVFWECYGMKESLLFLT